MERNYLSNRVLDKLPYHLRDFIVKQPYDEYTAQNQAVWRYVMRKNMDYLSLVAHESYIPGLKMAGISIDEIPRMEGMNRILKEIGWAAVSVDGFIPPNAFMEFQAYNTLVVAADIRTIDHIEYTPAPDIIHEAAGHAPIIANPEYAEYLRRFGEIGAKAISSSKDFELYEAIRHLSIIKEDPSTRESEIVEAEEHIEFISKNMGDPSEMAGIRNMHWWTVEYGLVGTLENPKIYGAGLLSSIGESKWCMSEKVKKIPYTIAAAEMEFDITKPQPQLFVTEDFAHLSFVLEEYANSMALRNGGLNGVQKLIESKNYGTIELSTGIQISGKFSDVLTDDKHRPIYFKTTGPTALAYKNKELIGHDKSYHFEGFGSPVGKLHGINLPIENMSPTDLEAYGIYEGRKTRLKFEGGIVVEGEIITGKRNLQGKIILISFSNCRVTLNDQVLFHPDWGVYDMAVGESVVSAFSGIADPNSFGQQFEVPKEKTHKITYSDKELALFDLYQEVREYRSQKRSEEKFLKKIFEALVSEYPKDWLLTLEIYELLDPVQNSVFRNEISAYLKQNFTDGSTQQLILDGMRLVNKS
ncbi:aromatic amino acid hydroxylase [Lutimonas zeaxanthinifaciens]|uniref:aromatic amino acid hydroxylase n=1 Tax=Lutimonas zeaxanthinifaciens TaxID=3060215 RepID=UPI00265CAE53|nr:aromatic amino acid hydroxylase [Lutimonas sp. YSD2104]WKK65824.1 aromatic amino acid hydroxylase [Lutimonas sp. YSD2104]